MKSFFLLLLIFLCSPAFADGFGDHYQKETPHKLTAVVFEDADGLQHALSDYRGRYVLLNVWATWCSPCVQEMPSLDAMQTHYDTKRLIIIPLSQDHGDAVVTSFYRVHGIKYLPVALDHAGIATQALGLRGLPTSILIDPQGNEIGRLEGDADWTAPDVIAFINAQMR